VTYCIQTVVSPLACCRYPNEIRDNDVDTLRPEMPGCCQPAPAAAAGDECDFSCWFVRHMELLIRWLVIAWKGRIMHQPCCCSTDSVSLTGPESFGFLSPNCVLKPCCEPLQSPCSIPACSPRCSQIARGPQQNGLAEENPIATKPGHVLSLPPSRIFAGGYVRRGVLKGDIGNDFPKNRLANARCSSSMTP
jgi:hypothetical protein